MLTLFRVTKLARMKFFIDTSTMTESSCKPHEVWLGNGVLVRVKDDLGRFVFYMKTIEEKNQLRERSVTRDQLQPVIWKLL